MKVSDQVTREKILHQNTDINLKWTNTINSFDNQIETLTHIAKHWSDLERDIITIEKSLTILTDRVKDIEFGQSTLALLEEEKDNILVSICLMY